MRRVAAALAVVVLAGCGEGDDELVVSAASSLQAPLAACAKGVRLQFGGSDELAAQIRQGVRADVFAAANTALPERLAREGLLDRPVAFATNRLVVAVREGADVASLDDLAAEGTRVVIGSEGVPIGDYARAVLARLGAERERAILANVRSEEPEAKGIVGKLAQGAADAGFVYRTDARAAGLDTVSLPDDLQPRIEYGAGVVRGSGRGEKARAFVDDLRSGDCADALRDAGFGR